MGAAMPAELADQSAELAALEPEDQARADWYGLLACLWYAAPDEALLRAIADGAGDGAVAHGEFDAAWQALAAAAGSAGAQSVRVEYDTVFVGTGKSEVPLYMTHYLPGTGGKERHLAQLRGELAQHGVARAQTVHEPEDHLAALCEVMRHLILRTQDLRTDSHAHDGDEAFASQMAFFHRHLAPTYGGFVAAALASPNVDFYKNVARFTQAFLDVEAQSFDMY